MGNKCCYHKDRWMILSDTWRTWCWVNINSRLMFLLISYLIENGNDGIISSIWNLFIIIHSFVVLSNMSLHSALTLSNLSSISYWIWFIALSRWMWDVWTPSSTISLEEGLGGMGHEFDSQWKHQYYVTLRLQCRSKLHKKKNNIRITFQIFHYSQITIDI